ncbi:beta-glucosidase BglX [Granulicella sp. L46]|uniref:beta-glucosidase BglX n=1 Tax=Granulicella sp. L46 TaxID=1641865 RepID=UPI0015770EBA|nr:beta-glucosidase BglX [Granulicella sp. L46]
MNHFLIRLRAGVTALMISSAAFAQSTIVTSNNPGLDARTDALLRQMTLDEKLGQLSQIFWYKGAPDDRIEKGELGSYLFLTDPQEINRVQHVAVEHSRLHIPLLIGFDVIHGFHTIFPVPIAQAASWDLELNRQIQAAAADEASAVGITWAFAPMVDIARDARWGRMVEGAGEDPFLGSKMATARVQGFQGNTLGAPHHVLACAKHFAGYGAAVGGRDYDAVYLSDTELQNVYLPPFHAAVEAGVGCIMSAYMDINDVPASGNRYLLHDVLRGDWHFNGFVVSDAWAVYNLTAHGFASDPSDAALRGITAGVNMDMGSDSYLHNLPKLLEEGKVTEQEIDAAVRPILRTKFELGLFEHPYVDESKVDAALHNPEHSALAREAAVRSAVLLRNEGGQLPLSKHIHSIAVIGPLADAHKEIQGSWSFGGDPKEVVSVLDGIRTKLGPTVEVHYAAGTTLQREDQPSLNPDKLSPGVGSLAGQEPDASINEAVAVAKASDQVVLVLGEKDDMSGEYASRASLALPGKQQLLLEAIAAIGKPVTLVLVNGRPLDITWASTHVPAILEAWFPGTQGGNAIADLLFGDANPGGKLPVSWPRNVGQEPLYYNRNLSQVHEDSPKFASYYWDEPQFPLYRFGFGLSYSSFTFSNLKLSSPTLTSDGIVVSIDVKNTSGTAGEEVVQLYTHQRFGSASRPARELKGFTRISLQPGETKTITLHVAAKDLSFWSPGTRQRATEASTYDVWVGDSSMAVEHAQFDVTTTMVQR